MTHALRRAVRSPLHLTCMVIALAACAADVHPSGSGSADLGDFPVIGKADSPVVVEVPFEVPGMKSGDPGESVTFTFRTSGQLAITTEQDESRSWERLQLVAESSDYRRRSWRGRAPYVTIPADRAGGEMIEYAVTVLNWGEAEAYGTLRVETEVPDEAGIEVVFNTPDCTDGCKEPAGALRTEIIDAIQSAEHTLDVAIYGLDDPAIIEALCNAAEAGVRVRAITDETSEDPNDSRSYYPAFFGDDGLAACGVQVDAVRSYGLMHHKFILKDRGMPGEVLVTGSTNFTVSGLEKNHNHMLFVRGVPELSASYQAEMDQLLRHCATDRLDGRESSCNECTPGCTEDVTPAGPWELPDGRIRAFFAPSDDTMTVLRGEIRTARLDAPDPACARADADCICRTAGSRWLCEYCATGENGWGLVGAAEDRVSMTMYSATDGCFALGLAKAARRGVEVLTVWDFVRAGSAYSRDDYVCAEGIPTYVSQWGGGSAQVRNHNKTVVIDDVVFDGSLNISASGDRENNENLLVIESPSLAAQLDAYVRSEIELLEGMGVESQDAAACRCTDLVDNDGDGSADGADPDCDAG